MHSFCIFLKDLASHALIFRAFGRKTHCWKILKIFDEKFNRKMEFFIIFGKFLTKNRAFGNNIIFLQFFRFGGFHFPPPGYFHEWHQINSLRLRQFLVINFSHPLPRLFSLFICSSKYFLSSFLKGVHIMDPPTGSVSLQYSSIRLQFIATFLLVSILIHEHSSISLLFRFRF